MGLKTIVDLRQTSEIQKSPELTSSGIENYNINMWGEDLIQKLIQQNANFNWSMLQDPSKATPTDIENFIKLNYVFAANDPTPQNAEKEFFL